MAQLVEPIEDWSLWDRFADESPQGSVFCKTVYFRALGRKPAGFWIREDERPLAGCVVPVDNDSQPLPSPHLYSLYHGVLLSPSLLKAPLHRRPRLQLGLIQSLLVEIEQRWERAAFCLHHNLDDLRGFQWFNYHTPHNGRYSLQLNYTGLIDLRNIAAFDDYLISVRGVKRQEYRKGSRFGCAAGGVEDIEALARLHRVTFERQGIEYSAQQESLMRSIARAAIQENFGELLLCRNQDGQPVGATLFLHDARTAYYLFGANHPDYRKTGTSTYLTLESIRRAFDRGIFCIDMVGINSPNRGDYKTSLNARPVPYFNAVWARPSGWT